MEAPGKIWLIVETEEDPASFSLGKYIRHLRLVRNITREYVATAIGILPEALRLVEIDDIRYLQPEHLVQLAEVLGCADGDLCTRDQPPVAYLNQKSRVRLSRTELGRAIQMQRLKLGLTRKNIACITGLPISYIEAIEKNLRQTSRKRLILLAKALQMHENALSQFAYTGNTQVLPSKILSDAQSWLSCLGCKP